MACGHCIPTVRSRGKTNQQRHPRRVLGIVSKVPCHVQERGTSTKPTTSPRTDYSVPATRGGRHLRSLQCGRHSLIHTTTLGISSASSRNWQSSHPGLSPSLALRSNAQVPLSATLNSASNPAATFSGIHTPHPGFRRPTTTSDRFKANPCLAEIVQTDGGLPHAVLHITVLESLLDASPDKFSPPAGRDADRRANACAAFSSSLCIWNSRNGHRTSPTQSFSVTVDIVVGKDGRVMEAHATSGREASTVRRKIALKWRFQPYLVAGEPWQRWNRKPFSSTKD